MHAFQRCTSRRQFRDFKTKRVPCGRTCSSCMCNCCNTFWCEQGSGVADANSLFFPRWRSKFLDACHNIQTNPNTSNWDSLSNESLHYLDQTQSIPVTFLPPGRFIPFSRNNPCANQAGEHFRRVEEKMEDLADPRPWM